MESLNKSFQAALDAFFYDHPELFYIDLTKITLTTKYTTFGSKTTYKVSLEPKNGTNYLYEQFSSKDKLEKAISQVQSLRNAIITQLFKDDYTKILTVHNTLIDLMQYDTSLNRANTHNIYGALIEKNTVCEGYAKAFKYILDGLNIPCILVSGTATNSTGKTESHMWNYVYLNNNWYGIDLTWDDPIIIGSTKGTIKHTYFCKGSYTFKYSHFPNGNISGAGMNFSIPTLSANDY